MKTYIISNGRRYSDHEVLFVEVQEGQDCVIPLFLDFCSRNRGEIYGIPKVMGIVDGPVEWREPNSSLSVLKFIDEIAFCVCDEDTELELQGIRRDAM